MKAVWKRRKERHVNLFTLFMAAASAETAVGGKVADGAAAVDIEDSGQLAHNANLEAPTTLPPAARDSKFSELLNQIVKEEKVISDLFSVFMTGDKDAYETDVRGMTSMRNALGGGQTTVHLQINYLEANFMSATLAQAWNVLRQVRYQLGHRDRSAVEKLEQDCKFDQVTSAGAVIPHFAWSGCDDLKILKQRCRLFLKDNVLASDGEIRVQDTLEKKEAGAEAAGDLISLDKAIRSQLMRKLQIELGAAQQSCPLVKKALSDRLSENLRTVLDLYSESWTNLATPW